MLIPRVFDFERDDVEAMRAHFKANGYVVVRALSEPACVANMKRQVTDLWLKQPWRQLLRVYDPRTKEELDIERDTKRYISAFTREGLDTETLARYRDVAPMHRGFGAACDPQVFHWPEVWQIREDPDLYGLAARIIGQEELWVDINRSIQKLPGEGEEEFLHLDIPLLFTEWKDDDSVGGKVIFNEGGATFVCVPRSNTREAHAAIRAAYTPLYPGAKPTDAKWTVDPLRDPLDLVGQRRSVLVPQGCCVFWSAFLIHGVEKMPRTTGLKMGMYLGYFKAGSRPEYARQTRGIQERDDRLESYREGRAPLLWPSFDPIHYYPKNFMSLGVAALQNYVKKTRDDWPGLSTRVIQTGANKGKVIADLIPVPDPDYRPPPLTRLGERLLGLREWPCR